MSNDRRGGYKRMSGLWSQLAILPHSSESGRRGSRELNELAANAKLMTDVPRGATFMDVKHIFVTFIEGRGVVLSRSCPSNVRSVIDSQSHHLFISAFRGSTEACTGQLSAESRQSCMLFRLLYSWGTWSRV